MLEQPRYELIPINGVEHQLDFLPAGAQVAVTCSSRAGIEATLDLCDTLAARGGFTVIPHLPARLVADEPHLDRILSRLHRVAIRDVFVIGGDAKLTPGLSYPGSLELARAINRRDSSIVIGVAGYPEGHYQIDDDDVLRQDLLAKQPYVDYVVTQLCFDATTVIDWAAGACSMGMTLPVVVGVPGVVDVHKLLQIATRVGVGDSLTHLTKNSGSRRFGLPTASRQTATTLVDSLARQLEGSTQHVAGLHIFSFNQVAASERWRENMIASIA